MHKITLPFSISVNSLFGGGSAQKRFPSKRYKAWLAECPKLEPLGIMYCEIKLEFFYPDARARDMDNHVKCVLDYLVKSDVIIDDCYEYLDRIELISGGIDRIKPRVEVTIMEKRKL